MKHSGFLLSIIASIGLLQACHENSMEKSKINAEALSKSEVHDHSELVEAEQDLLDQITPPNNITGSYLIACQSQLLANDETNDGLDVQLDCHVQSEERSPVIAQGEWNAQILNPLDGEAITIVDLTMGRFSLHTPDQITLANSLSRTMINFTGTIEQNNYSLTASADQALEEWQMGQLDDLIEQVPPPMLSPPAAALSCPSGYIAVAGDVVYASNDFCVMKYEAKNLLGSAVSMPELTPWVSISQAVAQAACRAQGPNFDLISNNEWLTISANLMRVANNWSGGSVGSGNLNRGHSDNNPAFPCPASSNDSLAYVDLTCNASASGDFSQRRTHFLSNGEVIWDFAGNVWDWTSYTLSNDNAKPFSSSDGSPQNAWRELTSIDSGFNVMMRNELLPSSQQFAVWNDTWDSSFGIGQYYAGRNGSGGALQRGGSWDDFARSGLYAAGLFLGPAGTFNYTGFRCVFRP